MATAVTLIVATMAAYAFGRLRFRLGRTLFVAVLSTMLVPVFVVAVTLFQVMADFQLIDTKRGLTLVFVATLTPLATWLLYNHVREMDIGPEEAALVDGCRRWQAFWRVVVPQMGSAIAAVAAITALTVWGEFLIPLLLTSTTQLQARDRPDHRVRRQVHDQLPARGGRRRARAAAARAARAAAQPAHHQRDGGLVVIRHIGYTRERLAQMSQRLSERIYPESAAARRGARERGRRPHLLAGGAGARVPAGRDRRALRAALGDVLVPAARDGAGGVARPPRRPALRLAERGDALARRDRRARAELRRRRRAARRPARACRRARADGAADRARLQRHVRPEGRAGRAAALRDRALRRAGVAALLRLRDAARARGRDA